MLHVAVLRSGMDMGMCGAKILVTFSISFPHLSILSTFFREGKQKEWKMYVLAMGKWKMSFCVFVLQAEESSRKGNGTTNHIPKDQARIKWRLNLLTSSRFNQPACGNFPSHCYANCAKSSVRFCHLNSALSCFASFKLLFRGLSFHFELSWISSHCIS